MAKQKESNIPDYLSDEWHDYVMTLFNDKELIEGHPNAAGLRRVSEILLGDIVESRPIDVYPPSGEGIGRSVVSYMVTFDNWKQGEYKGRKTFADVADVWEGNTEDMFLVHGPATACTRAESRVLRKALKIRGIAAEELCNKDASKFVAKSVRPDSIDNRIDDAQLRYINNTCRLLDIDAMKFINSGELKYSSVYQVTKDRGAKMVQALQDMKNNNVVPEDLKGYNEGWMN